MTIILNILPNIYWMYNNSPNIKLHDYNIFLYKQCELLNIKKVVELDDNFDAIGWGKSKQYNNEIKNNIEKYEFTKLLTILTKLNDLIKKTYITNDSLLISTFNNEYIELGLSIWIYFFYINAKISIDNIIKLLSVKIIGNIILTDELKKFLAFLNLNNILKK